MSKVETLIEEWRKEEAEIVRELTKMRATFPVKDGHFYRDWKPYRAGWREWCESVGLKRKIVDAIIDRGSVLP
jgi:hypothetical protein